MKKAKPVQVGDVVESFINKSIKYVVLAVRGSWCDVYLRADPSTVYTKQRRSIFFKVG
jgi:hypothetical protein